MLKHTGRLCQGSEQQTLRFGQVDVLLQPSRDMWPSQAYAGCMGCIQQLHGDSVCRALSHRVECFTEGKQSAIFTVSAQLLVALMCSKGGLRRSSM